MFFDAQRRDHIQGLLALLVSPVFPRVLIATWHPKQIQSTRRADLDSALGYSSPLDITMDSSKLEGVVGFKFKKMSEALSRTPSHAQCQTHGTEDRKHSSPFGGHHALLVIGVLCVGLVLLTSLRAR
jgi:hypothetical protein